MRAALGAGVDLDVTALALSGFAAFVLAGALAFGGFAEALALLPEVLALVGTLRFALAGCFGAVLDDEVVLEAAVTEALALRALMTVFVTPDAVIFWRFDDLSSGRMSSGVRCLAAKLSSSVSSG